MSEDMHAVALTLAALLDTDCALNVPASAAKLGIPVKTFRANSKKPGFPKPVKIGKHLTYRSRDLMRWWEQQQDAA